MSGIKFAILSRTPVNSLWPLANNLRPNQFLRILQNNENSVQESSIQRLVNQILDKSESADLVIIAENGHSDLIQSQLNVNGILFSDFCNSYKVLKNLLEHLETQEESADNDVIAFVPSDLIVDDNLIDVIKAKGYSLKKNNLEYILIGLDPSCQRYFNKSAYVSIGKLISTDLYEINSVKISDDGLFDTSEKILIDTGIVICKVGYLKEIISNQNIAASEIADSILIGSNKPETTLSASTISRGAVYRNEEPLISLSSWNSLCATLAQHEKVNPKDVEHPIIINELGVPIYTSNLKELLIVGSPDGILITDKNEANSLVSLTDVSTVRPMYEEKRWGWYRVIDNVQYPDGFCSLTKRLVLKPGKSISYQKHEFRDELWTIIDGNGEFVLEDEVRAVSRGDTLFIPKGKKHAIRSFSELSFIEVQTGINLVEEDITRYDFDWNDSKLNS